MKYPVSKSDYETFRNVTEVLIEQFRQQPRERNRFQEAAVKRFGEGADENHAFALFIQEIYSFRYISVITGYAKRNGLTWTNDCIRGTPDISILASRIKQKGRCDPEFTCLFFRNAGTASSITEPLVVIPILECVEEDHKIEIRVVERKDIEKALEVLMTFDETRSVSGKSLDV